MEGEALSVGEPPIEVLIRRNVRSRRMVLRVGRGSRTPVLTLPPGVPAAQARSFLHDHEDWLRGQLADLVQHVPVRDASILPFGDARLAIQATGRGRLHRAGDTLHVPGPEAQVPVRVGAFLRETARAACVVGATRHAARIGRAPSAVRMRDPKARWGSCTDRGELMFSWRLIMAPEAVLDYVVAHEVAHLSEMNHSARFWAVVRDLCPDYPRHRDWLRRHGPELHAYDFSPAAAPLREA